MYPLSANNNNKFDDVTCWSVGLFHLMSESVGTKFEGTLTKIADGIKNT